MQTVLFVRHGQSESNAGLPTEDPATIPLTRMGHQQAEQFANQFKGAPDTIAITKYLRTQQTAQPLIQRFPNARVHVLPLHEFTFLSPARCAGTTSAERKQWVDEYWERCEPHHVDGLGAECFEDFYLRIKRGLVSLKSMEGTTVVFTHGHVIRLTRQLLAEEPKTSGERMRIYRSNYLPTKVDNCEAIPILL